MSVLVERSCKIIRELQNHKQGYSVEIDSKMEPLRVDKQWVFYYLEIKKPNFVEEFWTNFVEEFCTYCVSVSRVLDLFMAPI
jgi:hypothetical protein